MNANSEVAPLEGKLPSPWSYLVSARKDDTDFKLKRWGNSLWPRVERNAYWLEMGRADTREEGASVTISDNEWKGNNHAIFCNQQRITESSKHSSSKRTHQRDAP
jgi:hypothetical protein